MKLSTTYINNLLRSNNDTRRVYRGIFPSDMLPVFSLFPNQKPAIIIVNRGTSQTSGSHWVLLYLPQDSRLPAYYFDSLGNDIEDESIKSFINRNNKRGYHFNWKRIQDLKSTNCGLFVLVAAWLLARQMSPVHVSNLFSAGNLKENDKRVRKLVKDMYLQKM